MVYAYGILYITHTPVLSDIYVASKYYTASLYL